MPPLQRVPRKMLAGLELHHLPSTASRLWKFFAKLRLYARQSVRLSLDQAYSVRHSALSNCANALRSTSKTREMSQPRMDMFTASPHSNARFRATRTPVVSKANFLRGTATTVLHRNYPVCSNSCPSTPNLIRKQIHRQQMVIPTRESLNQRLRTPSSRKSTPWRSSFSDTFASSLTHMLSKSIYVTSFIDIAEQKLMISSSSSQ
jgi:hypothetical protein